jgi:hypothetical protein
MSYVVTRSNGQVIIVPDGQLNTQTSVDLVGINYPNYAQIISTTQVNMLANFASATPPRNPVPGQLWYDTSAKQLRLNKGTSDNQVDAWIEMSDIENSGQANTSSNVGLGVGLALPKEGVDLPFKTLLPGANMTIIDNNNGTITLASSGGGTGGGSFLELDDTPNTYVGQQGKIVAVNAAQTGLEFIDSASGNAANIGGGAEVFAEANGGVLEFRTLTAAPTSGIIINWNPSSQVIEFDFSGTGGGGSLGNLSDVTITAPTETGQLLTFDGTFWVNSSTIQGDTTVSGTVTANDHIGRVGGYQLPGTDGTIGQVLSTFGSNKTTYWADAGTGGGGGDVLEVPNSPPGEVYGRQFGTWVSLFNSNTQEIVLVEPPPDDGPQATLTFTLIEPDKTSVLVRVDWTAVAGAGDYLLEISQYDPTGSFVVYQDTPIVPAETLFWEFVGFTNTLYEVRIRARNTQGLVGNWGLTVQGTSPGDEVPPAAPTDMLADAGLGAISLTWTNPSDLDYAYTKIYISTVASSEPQETDLVGQSAVGNYFAGGLSVGVTYYAWTAAVDTSGNQSVFSARVQAVPIGSILDIPPGSITALQLAEASVLAGKIADGAVISTKIEDSAITSGKISAGAVIAGKIATDAIFSNNITAGAIGTDKLAANSVVASKIAANTITSTQIQANSITGDSLQMNTIQVGTPNSAGGVVTIKGGYISGSMIQANTVQASNIRTDQLTAGGNIVIADGAISTPKLAANSITSAKIAAGAITATSVGTNQIIASQANIANGVITTAKIANAAITTAKIGSAQVGNAQIAELAISTVQIKNNNISAPTFNERSFIQTLNTTYKTIATVTVTVPTLGSGGTANMMISWAVIMDATGGNARELDFKLLRGSTTLWTREYSGTYNLKNFSNFASYVYMDNRGPGTYTYNLQMRLGGSTLSVYNAAMWSLPMFK